MVKRKDPLANKKEKAKHAGDAVRKVSRKVNIDEMYDAFTVDGPLVPLRSEVFFERKKEGNVHVCVGMYHSVYGDGSVDIWDETHQEFWGFNFRKELHLVKVKVPILPPPESLQEPTEPAEVVEPDPQVEELEPTQVRFKLFVDDKREPPDDSWLIARTSQEAIDFVTMIGGMPHEMALDHDLGLNPDGTEDTVPRFLKWLFETSEPNDVIPEYTCHSDNPEGKANIISFMESWKKSRTL